MTRDGMRALGGALLFSGMSRDGALILLDTSGGKFARGCAYFPYESSLVAMCFFHVSLSRSDSRSSIDWVSAGCFRAN